MQAHRAALKSSHGTADGKLARRQYAIRGPDSRSSIEHERWCSYELVIEELAGGEPWETGRSGASLALQRMPLQTPATVLCGGACSTASSSRRSPPERVVLALNPKNSFRETSGSHRKLFENPVIALLSSIFIPALSGSGGYRSRIGSGWWRRKMLTEVATHLHRTNERRIVAAGGEAGSYAGATRGGGRKPAFNLFMGNIFCIRLRCQSRCADLEIGVPPVAKGTTAAELDLYM